MIQSILGQMKRFSLHEVQLLDPPPPTPPTRESQNGPAISPISDLMILGGRIAQKLLLFAQTFCHSVIGVSAAINSPLRYIYCCFMQKKKKSVQGLLQTRTDNAVYQNVSVACTGICPAGSCITPAGNSNNKALKYLEARERETFVVVLWCVRALPERKEINKHQQ